MSPHPVSITNATTIRISKRKPEERITTRNDFKLINLVLCVGLSKDENERGNFCMKNKLITKIRNLVNTEETNKMEKQIERIEKSKDDSSRMFKAIKD